jgi:hypothetical protein
MLGALGNHPDQHFRRNACEAAHVMVLGHPKTAIAQFFGELRQIYGIV